MGAAAKDKKAAKAAPSGLRADRLKTIISLQKVSLKQQLTEF